MKLIIGLGNPEPRYDSTRHNVGFFVLDRYAAEQGTVFVAKDKFKATIAELNLGGEKVILAKPTTYYNLVGESARAIADFYKIAPADILIIHDDIALPLGTLRTREKGSDAGNNGMKSITQHLGPLVARLRIGTATPALALVGAHDFVLGAFTAAEQPALTAVTAAALDFITHFIRGDLPLTTHVIDTE